MLTRVEYVVGDTSSGPGHHWLGLVGAAFPTVDVTLVKMAAQDAWRIDLAEWCDPAFGFWQFDRLADEAMEAGATTVALIGSRGASFTETLGVLTTPTHPIATPRSKSSLSSRPDKGPTLDSRWRAHNIRKVSPFRPMSLIARTCRLTNTRPSIALPR
jgi:hypothetical protein